MIEDSSFVSGTVLYQRKIEYPNRSSWRSSQCPYLGLSSLCSMYLIPMRSCVRSSAGMKQIKCADFDNTRERWMAPKKCLSAVRSRRSMPMHSLCCAALFRIRRGS